MWQNWLWLSLVGAAGIVVLLLAAYWRLKRNYRRALAAIRKLQLAEIPPLAQRCQEVFEKSLGQSVSLDRLEESAAILDETVPRSLEFCRAFATPGNAWYFVLPTGAFVGELLRRHASGQWKVDPAAGPFLQIRRGQMVITAYPFEKALKHHVSGRPGELRAYVLTACGRMEGDEQVRIRRA
jgi:hypothetical protein